MPLMTDLGDLLLLLAPVTLLAAWIRQRQRAHRLCRPAGQPRLLSCRAAGLRPDDRHVYREGPHHRHPLRQYRDLGDLHDDLAGERGQCCAHKPRQSIRATGGIGGFGCRHRWRDLAGTRSTADAAFGQAIAQARAVLVNDPFEPGAVRRAGGRRPIDVAVVEKVGRLFIPISVILDLRIDPAGHELPTPIAT